MHDESLRTLLKDRTRELHQRLDHTLTGPGGRVADVPGYVRVLTVLHRLHSSADVPLARWARSSTLAHDLDGVPLPDRADAYAADLAALGAVVDEPTVPRDEQVDDARGLALLYLLAGSAAGARMLLRGLPDVVPQDSRRGLTDAAGDHSTTLWRRTCAVLSRPHHPRLGDAVVAEAEAVLTRLVDQREVVGA